MNAPDAPVLSGGSKRGRGLVEAVVVPFVVQRGVLFAVAAVAVLVLPPKQDPWDAIPAGPLLDAWLRYDSAFYLEIADGGYTHPITSRFFPGYPWLVRAAAMILPLPLSAVLVANAAALAGFAVFYRFSAEAFGERTAERAVWLLLLFPTSFFLSAAYAESTYFLATSLALLGWQRRIGWMAAVGVFIGTISRPVGVVCLTVPFVLEWLLRSRRFGEAPWFVLAAGAGAAVLLVGFGAATGNSFAFVDAGLESAHDAYVSQPDVRIWETLVAQGVGPELMRRLLNFGALCLAATAAVALWRRGHVALGAMTALSVGVPLLAQRTLFDATSMGRYLLAGAPFALALALFAPGEKRPSFLDGALVALQSALVIGFAAWVWVE